MKELLGENNEFGIITENNETALFEGIKHFLDNPSLLAQYRIQAEKRGAFFYQEETVKCVEQMLLTLS